MFDVSAFRDLCRSHGLAATYQRQLIYETAMEPPGHASAEAIYKKVNKRMPGISLATVYKNLHTFIDSGLLGQVTLHHGSLLVDGNREAHHHLVCVRCRSITDLKEEELGKLPLPRRLPKGFQVKRVAVDILGVCHSCAGSSGRRKSKSHHS